MIRSDVSLIWVPSLCWSPPRRETLSVMPGGDSYPRSVRFSVDTTEVTISPCGSPVAPVRPRIGVSDRRTHVTLRARQTGVVCGVPLALEAFRQLDPKVAIRVEHEDGSLVHTGDPVLFVTGHVRGLLSAERVALNYMQRLSAIASSTAAKILDTRKTTPGWRTLEKYAVRAGGGTNHRLNLSTGVLIKDNHLAALDGDVALAVRRARELAPSGTQIEVECDSVAQVEQATLAAADVILLDNMPPAMLTECVRLVAGRAILEASGGVTLATVRAIAETGVDWISVGALTHSPPAMDLALDFE